jgi:hypothetical protein
MEPASSSTHRQGEKRSMPSSTHSEQRELRSVVRRGRRDDALEKAVGMAAKRVLIIANEAVADRPAGVPDVVRRQVLEADEVRVVAPMLTGRLQSWVSDIDAAALAADQRMQAIVGSIGAAGQAAARGQIGDEDPLQAVADALAVFPADALILAVHAPDAANWRERRFGEKVRARFDLPVTEMLLDRDGRVLSVTAE